MSAHLELNSRDDFEQALKTKDKFVFIYAYENEISPEAEKHAQKFSHSTVAYKVDVSKQEQAKKNMGVSSFPAAIVYQNGVQKLKVEGMNREGMQEIAKLLSGEEP